MNHNTYTYCLLQYHHSQVLGEVLNIGALIYFPTAKKLRFLYPDKLIRLKFAYPNVPEKSIKAYFKFFESRVNQLNENTEIFADYDLERSLSNFVNSEFLTPDSSAIQFSDSKRGVLYTPDLDRISNQIYNLYFSLFDHQNNLAVKVDESILLKHYKKLLRDFSSEEENINSKLKFDYKIEPKAGTVFKFDIAWKNNDDIHLVKPISFDLTKPESITNKSYRYFGQFYDLEPYAKKEKLLFDVIIAKPKSSSLFRIYDNAVKLLSKPERVNLIEQENLSNYTKETILEADAY